MAKYTSRVEFKPVALVIVEFCEGRLVVSLSVKIYPIFYFITNIGSEFGYSEVTFGVDRTYPILPRCHEDIKRLVVDNRFGKKIPKPL